jgi:protein-disulfide isomerase
MASRKELKEQARAQREAVAEQTTQAEQRRRRLYVLLGLVLAAAAAIAVVIAATSGGGSKHPGLQKGPKANSTARGVNALLDGIPQAGNRLGSPSAPVTVTYFGDLECPVCRDFTLGSLPEVIAKDVRPGKVQIVYRALQTATPEPATFQRQQVAALAAGKQNRMWQYVELFYREQGQEGTPYATNSYLTGLARQVPGLDLAKWKTALGDSALGGEVRSDETAASVAGADATPTLVIKGPRGTKTVAGNVPAAQVESAVAAVAR